MVTQSIPLVADLRNQNRNIGTIYLATGLVTEGDTGGGIYFWNPSLTNPDDGFYYLQVTGVTTGRWARIYAGSNIYNTDGSLLDNRDVTLNNYYLKFIGSSANSTFNADGSVTLSSLSGVDTRMVVANNAGTLATQSFVPGTTIRFVEKFTATSGQTVFNTTNTLYSDLFDVFLNGVKLNTDSFSFTANQITLLDGAYTDDVIDVVGFSSATVYASLPSQAGNAGKYLFTNGTNLSWESISLTGFVPYTGATANVDLGEYELKAGQISLDVSPTGVASVGTTRWNDTIGSSETTLKGGSVILKNGVDLVARVVNKVFPNATLTKAAYQAVRISGAQGQRLAVAYAQADADPNSADTIGLVTETIPTNQEGFIMTVGNLEGVNTTGSLQGETWVDGDVLYLSPTVPGGITNVKPVAPQHLVVIGYVEYAHAINGKIYVKIMNGWELGELHDVNTAGATTGQVLTYNGTIWTPQTNATGNIYTTDGTLTGNRSVTMGAYTLSFEKDLLVNNHTIGRGAGNQSTNIAFGNTALRVNTTGTYNVGLGPESLYSNTTGNNNIAVGHSSLGFNTTGIRNVSIGRNALFYNTLGNYNSSLGWYALANNTTGEYNVAIGSSAGYGTGANANTTGSNNIFIGNESVGESATESNRTWIGNTSTASTWVGGNLLLGTRTNGTQRLQVYGDVRIGTTAGSAMYWDDTNSRLGIGTNAPDATLDVNGSIRFTGGGAQRIYSTNSTAYYIVLQSGSNTVDINGFSGIKFMTGISSEGARLFSTNNLVLQNGGTFTDSGQRLQVQGTSYFSDSVGIGASPLSYIGLYINKSITAGASQSWGISNNPIFLSDVTAIGTGYVSNPATQNAVFTLSSIYHIHIKNVTKGASNTLNNQYGFVIDDLTSASSNYGIYSAVSSGVNKWNLYMNGTASNYLEGDTAIGTTTLGTATKLTIGGSETASSAIARGGLINTTLVAAANNDTLFGLDINPTFNNGPFTGVIKYSARIFQQNALLIATDGGTIDFINNGGNGRIRSNGGTLSMTVDSGNDNTFPLQIGHNDTFGTKGMSLAANVIRFQTGGFVTTVGQIFSTSGNWLIQNGGTFTDGGQRLQVQGTSYFSDRVGFGSTGNTSVTLRNELPISGSSASYGYYTSSVIQSTVTSLASYFTVIPQTQSSSFNITRLSCFDVNDANLGAGSSVTNLNAYWANISAGTGRWNLFMNGTANNYMAGSLGIGNTSLVGFNLSVNKNITGSTTSSGISQAGFVQTDVTGNAYGFVNTINTANSLTLTNYFHFRAIQSSIGSGNTISAQFGIYINDLTAGTANYGFNGNLSAGLNKWNLYMGGTADNYLAGDTAIGTTSLGTATKLTIGGTKTASSAIARGGLIDTTLVASDNNDVLVGLDINPTFTNGAFTGVRNAWIRVGNYSAASTSIPANIDLGATFSNVAGQNLKLKLFNSNSGNNADVYGVGVSVGQLDYHSGGGSHAFWANATPTKFMQLFGTGNLLLQNGGTFTDGGQRLQVQGTSYFSDSVGIGSTSLTGSSLRIDKNLTGSTTVYGIRQSGVIQSDVTNAVVFYATETKTQAASFNISDVYYFQASQGSLGASSSITNQYGFFALSNMTGATNNYGFYGNIPNGTNRWNLFMNGTANNYMAGRLGLGNTGLGSITLRNELIITGSTSAYGYYTSSVVQPDVTSTASYFIVIPQTTAASFTLSRLSAFEVQDVNLGAGSSVTNTNAFYGNISLGSGRWNIFINGTANNYMAGSLGIGSTSLTGYNFRVSKNLTGGGAVYGVMSEGSVQSDVTAANYYQTFASVQNTAFTLLNLRHFQATGNSSFGSATVTNQFGFLADSALIGATNNYGFYGNIPNAANRWNIFMAGTADNYLAGSLGIGGTFLTGVNLSVSKNITGSATSSGISQAGFVQTDVTGNAYGFVNTINTANSLTLTNYFHFRAIQSSIGSGNTISAQFGIYINDLTAGTANYGFNSNLSAGLNKWNLYMSGTADNYLAGKLLIGTTTVGTFNLDVNGTARVQGTVTTGNVTSSSDLAHDIGSTAVRYSTAYIRGIGSGNAVFSIFNNSGTSITIASTNNVLLGTTTDAGYRLDVNGTARVSGLLTGSTGAFSSTTSATSGSPTGLSSYLGVLASTSTAVYYGLSGIAEYQSSVYLNSTIDGTSGRAGVTAASTNKVNQVTGVKGYAYYDGNSTLNPGNTSLYGGRFSSAITGTGYYGHVIGIKIDQPVVNGTSNQITGLYIMEQTRSGTGTVTATSALHIEGAGIENAITWAAGSGSSFNGKLYSPSANNFIWDFTNGINFGSATANTSAKLQVDSTTKGFLPPRMTSTQLAAISSPAVGLVAYQTDGTEGLYQYKSTGWALVGGTGGGSGTVTSVDMSVPTGFAISGNPVTTSGTLALAFASGYSLPTTVKQSNWDDAYTWVTGFPSQTSNNGKYLTTDGSALSWATIPVYTLAGLGGVPTSRTLTINGTALDLSADRSWTVSAAAAGTTGQLQYNNAGALGGASYVNINQGHIELIDAGTLPTAPSTGRVILFSEDHAGKSLPSVLGPSGVDYNLQAALYGNTTYMWMAGTGTTVAINWGTSFTARNSGTSAAQSHPTKASTNAMTSMNRANFGTGTTATGASGIQTASTVAWLGNAAGLGGFLFFARFGIETLASDVRAFVGLSANNATMAADASTWANTIGIGKDTADSTWQIISRSATTLTKTNTTITVTQNQILDVYIHSAPNSGTIRVHIKDGATGADLYVSGALTTNIPAAATFLYMQAHIQSVTGTTAKNLALNRMYLETDL